MHNLLFHHKQSTLPRDTTPTRGLTAMAPQAQGSRTRGVPVIPSHHRSLNGQVSLTLPVRPHLLELSKHLQADNPPRAPILDYPMISFICGI